MMDEQCKSCQDWRDLFVRSNRENQELRRLNIAFNRPEPSPDLQQEYREMKVQNRAMMDVHNLLVKEHGEAVRQVPALSATIARLKRDIVLIHQICTPRQRYKLRRVLWLDQQEIEHYRKSLHPEYMYGHGKKRKTG
jgi:hypothetical protein